MKFGNLIAWLFLYLLIDFSMYTFAPKRLDYYSLRDMYTEYVINQQDLTDVVFRKETAWQLFPLIIVYFICVLGPSKGWRFPGFG